MKSCEQTSGQSVLQHGISVKNYTFDIINHLRHNTSLKYEWKLPDWVYENKDLLLSSLPSDKTLKYYTVLHDCGKPYCLEIDSDGKERFPNHADVSYRTFSEIFDDKVAADLIRHDMDIHLLKSDDFSGVISSETTSFNLTSHTGLSHSTFLISIVTASATSAVSSFPISK